MTVKLEAAYHEAGHAVAGYFSQFHRIVGSISLAEYGAGDIYVALSVSKLQAAGMQPDVSARRHPEVAKDLAIVLSAGLVAERLAARKNSSLKPNPDCAEPDHDFLRQELKDAGLSQKFDRHETAAERILTTNWSIVEGLAQYLFSKGGAESLDILEFIESARQSGTQLT